MQKLSEKRMSQKEAASVLAVSVRHVKRLLSAYRQHGAQGLISKRGGRPSNNHLAKATRQKALDFLKSKYQGFGPTLAHEKLVEKEGLKISDESIPQLMIVEGQVDTIDDGIQVLTGVEAGKNTKDNPFKSGSLFESVNQRLDQMASDLAKFRQLKLAGIIFMSLCPRQCRGADGLRENDNLYSSFDTPNLNFTNKTNGCRMYLIYPPSLFLSGNAQTWRIFL